MKNWNAVALISSFLVTGSAVAEDEGDAAHRETVKNDLFAVITLNGANCVEVVDYEVTHETLYLVTCKNGKHYRVEVTQDGRVEVGHH